MYIKERKVRGKGCDDDSISWSDELQALEEIMQHMREVYSFAPSKRAFQTQFRRWGSYKNRLS
jgi:Clr5 domain